MNPLRVALLQMQPIGADQQANLEKGDRFCREAAANGADVALFPEMWNIGYQGFDRAAAGASQAWIDQAVAEDGPFVRHFAGLAGRLGMAIAVTYLARGPGLPRNAVSLFDRHGELSFTYSKVHTCCYETPEAVCAPGGGFVVRSVDTRAGPVHVGAMICYDREFPESARLLMLQGAELILTPNACKLMEYDGIRIHQFRSRAFENMVAGAMTNYPGPAHDGHSIACNPDGGIVVEAGEAEGLVMAEFDLDWVRAWRSDKYWGDAFRRPSKYAPLAENMAAPPFLRTDLYGAPLDLRRSA
jgi:predicted amidohydrolase